MLLCMLTILIYLLPFENLFYYHDYQSFLSADFKKDLNSIPFQKEVLSTEIG